MASWEMQEATFPPHIMLKARDGEIGLKDLLLIHVISKLTKHTNDGASRGCKASNAYLADAVGASTKNYVSDRIRYLKERGWLLTVEVDGQRYIEMEWNRTQEEREELTGEYGILLRLAYKRIEKRQKKAAKQRDTEISVGGEGTEKTVSPPTEKTGGGVPKKQYHKNKDNIKGDKKEHSRPADEGAISASLNGRFNLDHVISNGNPPAEKLAARLFQILLKHRKLTRYYEQSPVKKWAKEFTTLLQVFPVDEIREVIERYDIGIKDKFVPQGYCGKTFCEKYVKIKEALVRTNLLEPAPENPDDGQRTVEWRENGKLFKKIISN